MTPRLTGIDHVHVSVSDWAIAGPWYETILGLRRVAAFEAHGVQPELSDHDLAFSMYFQDPDDNTHEICTYDHAFVRERLTKK